MVVRHFCAISDGLRKMYTNWMTSYTFSRRCIQTDPVRILLPREYHDHDDYQDDPHPPRGWGIEITAVSLASQFHQHIIMGHSHNYSRQYDPSGQYWAIQTGCCVDERRLAYASQRDRGATRHALGAVLVYGGYPWDLSELTPWQQISKIAN